MSINSSCKDEYKAVTAFRSVVKQTPQAPAVFCDGQQYSYKQIDERSDAAVQSLKAKGVGSGDVVGINVRADIQSVTYMLATMKLGAVGLLVPSDIPQLRLGRVLEQTTISVWMDGDMDTVCKVEKDNPPLQIVPDTDKAMGKVLYEVIVVNSEGVPTTLGVDGDGLYNRICHQIRLAGTDDRIKAFASTSLASIDWLRSVLTPLLSGGELHIYPIELCLKPLSLLMKSQEDGVNWLNLTKEQVKESTGLFTKNNASLFKDISVAYIYGLPAEKNFYEFVSSISFPVYITYGMPETLGDSLYYLAEGKKPESIRFKPCHDEFMWCLYKNGQAPMSGAELSPLYGHTAQNEMYTLEKLKAVGENREPLTQAIIKGQVLYHHECRVVMKEIENVLCTYPGILSAHICTLHIDSAIEGLIIACYKGEVDNFDDLFSHVQMYLPETMLPAILLPYEVDAAFPHSLIDRNYLHMDGFAEKLISYILFLNGENKGCAWNIDPNSDLEMLGIHSIGYVASVIQIETLFLVEFEDSMLLLDAFKTVESFVQYILGLCEYKSERLQEHG